MGLYERLVKEAKGLPEDRGHGVRRRMANYPNGLRGPAPEGGYVRAEELQEEVRKQQERRRREVRNLAGLVANGPSGVASAYALGALKRKHPLEYAGFVSDRRTRRQDQRAW